MSALKHSELTFQLIVESAPNALIVVNVEGKIAFVNAYAEKLFGFAKSELVGQPIEIVIPPRYHKGHPGFRNMFFGSPKARPMGAGRELFGLRKDGTEFPVEIGLNPLVTVEGTWVLAAIIDITERKQAEERFRLVVESAPNAMVLVNSTGKITLVNSQTERLFGYGRNEMIGQGVELLIPQRFSPNHPNFLQSYFSTPNVRPMGTGGELFARRKDGSEFPVEIGLNPINSPVEMLVLASIQDITEKRILEANRLKNDFLTNMSHELRTPLNAVLGFSELMIDKKVGELNAKQLEYLNDIHASGTHLLRLINDVLDLSKIEAGKAELSIEIFTVADVIDGVINVLRPMAQKKGMKINTDIGPDISEVSIDKSKFKQILFNLVSNAIKFSHENTQVKVRLRREGEASFILQVIDVGIGIAQQDMGKLFMPFVQLDQGLSRKHEGSGLGLTLVKNIVTLHHGEINVISALGKGTTVTVILPRIFNPPTK